MVHGILRTGAVTNALQEVQPDGHHMRSGVVSREVVGGNLIGVPKIENRFFEAHHGANVERFKELVVQETVRYARPIIIFVTVVLPELKIDIGTGTFVATEHLHEHTGLELQPAFLWSSKSVARIELVVQQQTGL